MTTKKKATAWAIMNPDRKLVGFGRDRLAAWLDVPPSLTHYPYGKRPKGYRAVRVLVSPL